MVAVSSSLHLRPPILRGGNVAFYLILMKKTRFVNESAIGGFFHQINSLCNCLCSFGEELQDS